MPAPLTCSQCKHRISDQRGRFCSNCAAPIVLDPQKPNKQPAGSSSTLLSNTASIHEDNVHFPPVGRWNWGAFWAAPLWAWRHGVRHIPLMVFGCLVLLQFIGAVIGVVIGTANATTPNRLYWSYDHSFMPTIFSVILYGILCLSSIRFALTANATAWATGRWSDVNEYRRSQRIWAMKSVAVPAIIGLIPCITYALWTDAEAEMKAYRIRTGIYTLYIPREAPKHLPFRKKI